MKYRLLSLAAMVATIASLTLTAHAQDPERPAGPNAPATVPAPPMPPSPPGVPDLPGTPDLEGVGPQEPVGPRFQRRNASPTVRVGQNYTIREGESVRELVVISGAADVQGTVDGDTVVILGTLTLGSKARITGDLVVVGGTANVASGAIVEGDFVAVTTSVNAPTNFTPGSEQVVIDPLGLGGRLQGVVPWITRGLLWGRLVVPDLGWVWGFVAVVFFVYLLFVLLFPQAVRATTDALTARPLSAFLVGLLVLVLSAPVSIILVASVVGIAVVPVLSFATVIAGVVGRISFSRWLGGRLIAETDPDSRPQIVRSFALGFILVIVTYMIPILGIMAWCVIGVFGLGAATMAAMSALRRENPSKPKPVPPPEPVPPSGTTAATPAALAYDVGPVAPSASQMASAVLDIPVNPVAENVAPTSAATATAISLAGFPRAEFLPRLAAFVLDVTLVMLVLAFIDRGNYWFSALLAYHIGFWTFKGTTVGGIICNLRVVRSDGAPLQFVDALIRGLASVFSLAVFGLGGLWILRDPERQAWHDIIAGTLVVTVPRHFRGV